MVTWTDDTAGATEVLDDASVSLSATDISEGAVSVDDVSGGQFVGTFGQEGWTFGEKGVGFGGIAGVVGQNDESSESNFLDITSG